MISVEPTISVGIIESVKHISGILNAPFELHNSIRLQGIFSVKIESNKLVVSDNEGAEVIRSSKIRCNSLDNATVTLIDVTIGKNFHWERKENQTFEGNLTFLAVADGTITVTNEIGVERYLKSVISSEMNAEAPIEFLKAHAITSRSWLLAMLEHRNKFKNGDVPPQRSEETRNETIRWYDREDHKHFDVCADDHCQRYQGITRVISKSVLQAMSETRGMFLVHENEICDARFSKSCGGLSEVFETCWGNTPIPYLQSVSDSAVPHPPITSENEAERWILSSPEAYCNTNDGNILRQVLPQFDRETTDFFRWKVEYSREQLEEILRTKSGIDFGTLMELVPVKRGPSARIYKLKIIGTKQTVIVGKELEIRRWLSKSHLYSSAFAIKVERDTNGIPVKFALLGAGWGHGVGLCQIGAAVMATKGYTSEEILKHYFRNTELRKLY